MMRTWQLQEAKNKFSEVVAEALESGPQVISRHGVETAVVISYADYCQRFAGGGKSKLTKFLSASPLAGSGLEVPHRRNHSKRSVTL